MLNKSNRRQLFTPQAPPWKLRDSNSEMSLTRFCKTSSITEISICLDSQLIMGRVGLHILVFIFDITLIYS